MDKKCDIIQDLLPLYVDEVCSQASKEMVNEHLQMCSQCNNICQQLRLDTNEEILNEEKTGIVERYRRKLKGKRIRAVLLAVIITLAAVFLCSNIRPVVIDLGISEIYSEQEMNDAIDLIKEEFNSWHGCKLYSISYAGDDYSRKELEYCNTLAPDGITYAEAIVFRMSFRSPIFGGGGFNSNFRYDWSWYLARTENGDWEVLTWGVP